MPSKKYDFTNNSYPKDEMTFPLMSDTHIHRGWVQATLCVTLSNITLFNFLLLK